MEVQQQFGDQVNIVGVPSLSSLGSIERFVEDRGIGVFENIPDIDGEIWARFDVTQQRTYVLINDDGTWERTGYGSLAEDVQDLISR